MTAPVESKGMRNALLGSAGSLSTTILGGQVTFAAPDQPSVSRVSVSSAGFQGNGDSTQPRADGSGDVIVFSSDATNLVAGDLNQTTDVFVRLRLTGVTTRVSVSSVGTEANGGSGAPSVSADGRYVAFSSNATNLVPMDTNGQSDIFLHDRLTGVTKRLSVSSTSEQANGPSYSPRMSANGGIVVFESTASNLVVDDSNGVFDVFLHDVISGETTRVSRGLSGAQSNGDSRAPSISSDGNRIAFDSRASNLIPNDTNGSWDAFVFDAQLEELRRVSMSSTGVQGNGNSGGVAFADATSMLVFMSRASNLVVDDTNGAWDIFQHDLGSGITTRVNLSFEGQQGNGDSLFPDVSADGRFVAFESLASSLVPDDTNAASDIFVVDLATHRVSRASVSTTNVQGNGASSRCDLSESGRTVVYDSQATNLVAGDTNHRYDTFAWDSPAMPPGAFSLISPAIGVECLAVHPAPLFSWSTSSGAIEYDLELGSDLAFAAVVYAAAGLTGTTHSPPLWVVDRGQQLYWRVLARNGDGQTLALPNVATLSTIPLGDVDQSGVVAFADLNSVLSTFGARIGDLLYNPLIDLNHDGTINFGDLNMVLAQFGSTC